MTSNLPIDQHAVTTPATVKFRFRGMNQSHNKPCPACRRAISENKDMCFACITEHGTVLDYFKKLAAATTLVPVAEDNVAPVKPKRTRRAIIVNGVASEEPPKLVTTKRKRTPKPPTEDAA
jgi:hypothetical protein